ncbi:electron transport complex subunit RsxB [Solimicrobium silvestre]|uniref:RnfB: electron transport complex, RnfABCDGE type, B subunit n=1 Tax=Solimicrobium silvestre TaxID=2099400 RepID=A0A2S9GZ10_9BURK|nr:electron transport complex subunit RsxB [Solimicrobium silvestre]PRC92938.1 rnfB: electron transport complex, RnfABCDGE type, B subunit [Solimicrobium silvestre]
MPSLTPSTSATLADQIEDLLPQTQCTKCGFPACRPYAEAIASGAALYNQCPPGGDQGIARLAQLLQQPILPLNVTHGVEHPRAVAVIDEAICIGCTLCIQACPVDAIVGAAKQMHSVIIDKCTGCDLCLPPCPVDCISMVNVTGEQTGWNAWSAEQANAARARHDFRITRLEREKQENDARLLAKASEKLRITQAEIATTPEQAIEQARKKAIINAAIARAMANKPK